MAAVFLVLQSIALTLAPAARLRTWDVSYRWEHWIGMLFWLTLIPIAEHQIKRWLPDADPYLFPVSALLTGWGMLSIWRLTDTFGIRQAIWVLLCLVLFIVALRRADLLTFLKRYKYIWLTSGLLLTALTFLFGDNPGGTGPRLWLGCCGVYLQPSEPLKLLLVVYLAAYFAGRFPQREQFFPNIFPTLFLAGLALLILLIQRDLGTASIFVLLYACMLYLASGRKRIPLFSLLILSGVGLVGYFFIGIIQTRVDSWLNPWNDPSGRSYQIIQSLLAIANGGLLGRGPGMGSPGLVPVAHSDFIFTTLAEENGMVGTLALYLIIAMLVMRGYWVAVHAREHFQRLLAAGLSTYLGLQSLLILGGNLRLLPLTGVTLPFVSYGGSSLLTSYFAILLLLHISNASENDPAYLPKPTPYLLVPALVCIGLLAAALLNGWWAFFRAEDLLARTDNPRRSISDQYVQRGSLLDRKNNPLVTSVGETGSFKREYAYPPLSPIIGYTHPVYGQTGLELELDRYLRGLSGYPALQIWWEHLLYGQPPPGLDVRLSLDSDLQRRADTLMANHTGALLVLNAESGEILAIASHPTYDANQLDEIGADLLTANNAPLLNRAQQGSYAPGTALGPFLLAEAYDASGLPKHPATLVLTENSRSLQCAYAPVPNINEWGSSISAGCPNPLVSLGAALGDNRLHGLMRRLGLNGASLLLARQIALGQEISVSPAQMATAAGALSNHGQMPGIRIAMAVKTPEQGWVILPSASQPTPVFTAVSADRVASQLLAEGKHYWESMGLSQSEKSPLTWYMGGSLPNWQGTPLAVVLVLEENNPQAARDIGRKLIEHALGK